MEAIILFLVGFMMLGGYNSAADERDLNRGVHKPLYWETAENTSIDVDVRINPGVIRQGETIIIRGDGYIATCQLLGTQLHCSRNYI